MKSHIVPLIVISIFTLTESEETRFFVTFILYSQFLVTRCELYNVPQNELFFLYKMTASASNAAEQTTSNQTTFINDTKCAWKFEFAWNDMAVLRVFDDKAMDIDEVRRLRSAIFAAGEIAIHQLEDNAPADIKRLCLFWTGKGFLKLTRSFQLPDNRLKKKLMGEDLTRFPSVVARAVSTGAHHLMSCMRWRASEKILRISWTKKWLWWSILVY